MGAPRRAAFRSWWAPSEEPGEKPSEEPSEEPSESPSDDFVISAFSVAQVSDLGWAQCPLPTF